MRRYLLPLFAVLLGLVQPLHAQLQVSMEIKRHFLMVYEPIMATVTVKNLAGRDVTLADSATQSWFGFQINRADGQLVPPLDPNYRLSPLTVPAGQTIRRTLMLNTLFPIHELGLYRIRATIYYSAMDKYFQSALSNVELSEGKTIWQQTVGVPDGVEGAGGTRRLSLLSFRQADYTYLYVRVEDVDGGVVYAATSLGRVIAGLDPDAQVDQQNNLHVLQVGGAKTYVYSCIGLNGEVLARDTYFSAKVRPALRRDAAGRVTVYGGQLQAPDPAPGSGKAANKLSDRPVPLPKD
ncbi:MAG: hypothetical protein PHQ12_10390 [Chthoniobacteraceae bacterium]|nr:hypothetical protein [Chthoniobacteraceae bacterium]